MPSYQDCELADDLTIYISGTFIECGSIESQTSLTGYVLIGNVGQLYYRLFLTDSWVLQKTSSVYLFKDEGSSLFYKVNNCRCKISQFKPKGHLLSCQDKIIYEANSCYDLVPVCNLNNNIRFSAYGASFPTTGLTGATLTSIQNALIATSTPLAPIGSTLIYQINNWKLDLKRFALPAQAFDAANGVLTIPADGDYEFNIQLNYGILDISEGLIIGSVTIAGTPPDIVPRIYSPVYALVLNSGSSYSVLVTNSVAYNITITTNPAIFAVGLDEGNNAILTAGLSLKKGDKLFVVYWDDDTIVNSSQLFKTINNFGNQNYTLNPLGTNWFVEKL